MKKLGCSLAFAVAALAANSSHAALLDVSGDGDTSSFTIPANNDFDMAGLVGQIGAHVYANSTAPINLTFEYLFKEANLTNSFWIGDTEVFNNRTSPYGTSYSMVWDGGNSALNFRFLTGLGVEVANDPDSANQNDGNAAQKFFTYWDGSSNEILLGLDDSGARRDADHDDMIVRITASAISVPEPTSLALLGLGLAGAATGRRLRKA